MAIFPHPIMELEDIAQGFVELTKLAQEKPLVLVVEDDQDNLEMVVMFLEMKGYRVLAANTVEKALHLARTNDGIHTLLTDFHLGNLTANDLISTLGDRKPKNVVLLSGRQFENDPKEEVPGINHHIQKPFDINKLVKKIDEQEPDQRNKNEPRQM